MKTTTIELRLYHSYKDRQDTRLWLQKMKNTKPTEEGVGNSPLSNKKSSYNNTTALYK